MDIAIKVKPFDGDLKEAYLRLLPEQATGIGRGRLAWRFEKNPASTGIFSVATDAAQGNVVGINAFAAARLKMGERTVLGFQSMDTIVDPVCRGQGLFTRLLKAFYEAAPELKTFLLYGFPNGNSAPGFFNKLGWTRLSSPPFLIKPLRTGYFAKRILGDAGKYFDLPLAFARAPQGIETITRFDERFTRLWKKFSEKVPCALERNADYLNWRIADNPEFTYTTKAVVENGELKAFLTYTELEKHGGRIGYVMEAMGDEAALAKLFRAMTAEFMHKKVDAVLAWCPPHAPNHKAHRRAGFLPMPEKIRPIELHFGARLFPVSEGEPGLKYEDWYLSYLDSDTV